MERAGQADPKMLPPPAVSKKTLQLPASPKPSATRKSSISRQPLPLEFASASPTIRNKNSLYNTSQTTIGASPSRSNRDTRTPSLGARPAPRRETDEQRFLMDIFDDHGLLDDQESSKGPRKRPLFGHPERKNKRRAEEPIGEKGEKESSHQPTEVQVQEGPSNRRFLAHSPRTLSSPRSPKKRTHTSTHGGKGWPVAERVYGEESKLVQSKRGSPMFGHTEDRDLEYDWFEGQRIDRGTASDDGEESYGEETRSSPYYEEMEDNERTILGPSSSPAPVEKKKVVKEKVPGLAELHESLKLIPDPAEYQPGAYNSLSDEQWLAAGQQLIERFVENSHKIQRIISTRAERMVGYTALISEYHSLLRSRRAKLKEERESIQESVRGSIAGYCKSHDV